MSVKKDSAAPSGLFAPDNDSKLDLNPQLFKQVLEASGVAMVIRGPNLRPLFANKAFVDFYGYSIEEMRTIPLADAVPEETYVLFMESIGPAVLGGKSWEGEYVIRTKAGRLCQVWGRFDPVIDDDGNVTHAISIMRDASASMRLRNALTQTERHLHFLAENTSDCLFRLRLSDGRYDYISSAVESITGYPPQEFYEVPRLFERLTPSDWAETFETWWGEFLAGINRYEYESPIIHRDGGVRWINQRATVVTNEEDKPEAIEGIITDVTERHLAREELETAQNSLNFISHSTSDIFFRLTVPEGKYDYLSPSVERFSGYTLQEYEDNPLLIRDIFHPDWADYFQETWEEIMRGEVRPEYVFQYVHKSGETRWARQRVVLHKDDDGTPIAIEGIASDITEAKRAEAALRASEQQYRLLVENMTDVVWTQDNDARFTYATPSAETLWGYSFEELGQLNYRELFTPESRDKVIALNKIRRAREAEGNYSTVHRDVFEHMRKDGTTLWAESVVRRMFSDDGKPSGYLGVTRDVTEQKMADLALAESEDRFRTLFEESPISMWEEDLTRLKAYFDELKDQGITDFRRYFYENPEALGKCATLVDVVAVNKATLDLLRARDQDDLLGNLDTVLTERSMAAFTEEMILLASGGCEYCGEITHRTLDGDIIWVVVHFSVPPKYRDTLSRVIVSLLDVTPRKRAEQALMESEERYRILVENAQEGVVVVRDDRPLFVNEAMADMLGYSVDEMMELEPFERLHPEDRDSVRHQMRAYFEGESKEGFAVLRALTKQDEVKWVTLGIKPIMWGGEEAEIRMITDITAHKMLEEELRSAHSEMEERVRLRTAELSAEVEERQKAQEHILSLTQQLIRIQEDERQRIARDLHDNVAQDLSSIVLNMETLFDGHSIIEPQVLERGKAVTDIVRGAIGSVRTIAYGLRPPALDQLGLPRAIKQYCDEIADRCGVDIDFFATGIENATLDFDTEINIYRMIQEALNNMAKHAEAERASVRLVRSHPDLLIRIEDNGGGFEVGKRMSEAVEEKRMGLKSMEERARLIGGSMEVQSLVGTGTRIIFKIPLADARRQ